MRSSKVGLPLEWPIKSWGLGRRPSGVEGQSPSPCYSAACATSAGATMRNPSYPFAATWSHLSR